MSQAQFNLAAHVLAMPVEARLPVLRKLTNSTIAATFGAIRQHLREEAKRVRDESRMESVDNRTELDEFARGQEHTDQVTEDMGHVVEEKPLQRAQKLFAVFCWANAACRTDADSVYDEPLTPEGMLQFQIERTALPNEAILKQWADAANCTIDDIKKMKTSLMEEERTALLRDKPAMLSTFNSFGDWAHAGEEFDGEDAVTNLEPLQQYQLGVKALTGLIEGYNKLLQNAMRRNDVAGLSQRPIILAEIHALTPALKEFETKVKDDILRAGEAGRRVNTLDDLRTQLRNLPKPAAAPAA